MNTNIIYIYIYGNFPVHYVFYTILTTSNINDIDPSLSFLAK